MEAMSLCNQYDDTAEFALVLDLILDGFQRLRG